MRSKREIILELRSIHNQDHRVVSDVDCPFCQRKKDNAERLVSTIHESSLLNIIQSHTEHWERLGARIANRIHGHQLPMELVAQILTSWIVLRVNLPDTPEDYIHHPLVLELFADQQKNEDSE